MSEFTGTAALTRFILRRDRVRILVWIGAIAVLVVLTAASVKGLYPTQADLDEAPRPPTATPPLSRSTVRTRHWTPSVVRWRSRLARSGWSWSL